MLDQVIGHVISTVLSPPRYCQINIVSHSSILNHETRTKATKSREADDTGLYRMQAQETKGQGRPKSERDT